MHLGALLPAAGVSGGTGIPFPFLSFPFLAFAFSIQRRIHGRDARRYSMVSASSPGAFRKKFHYSLIDFDLMNSNSCVFVI